MMPMQQPFAQVMLISKSAVTGSVRLILYHVRFEIRDMETHATHANDILLRAKKCSLSCE